jgi:Kef-type K+ transport system membrane component KefB
MAIAFAVPLTLSLAPGLRVPAVVVELVAGIVVGPSVLGLVEVDAAVEVLALLGLAMLLFLAGLEIELDALRGPLLRLALASFALSFALGLAAGLALRAAGEVQSAVFVAIVLSATSLGVVIPVLRDAGATQMPLGRIVIAAASVADIATILLLSLLFSEEGGSVSVRPLRCSAASRASPWPSRSPWPGRAVLRRLGRAPAPAGHHGADPVRGAMLLLVVFAAAAQELGWRSSSARSSPAPCSGAGPRPGHEPPNLRTKLDAVGFGLLVPVFFVARAACASTSRPSRGSRTLGARGQGPVLLPACSPSAGSRACSTGGRWRLGRPSRPRACLQATSLPFIVAATAIGVELDALAPSTAAALVAAGLLSLLLFPAAALGLLRR